ncbi:hypothetical protein BurJ1DRAFT_4180 [Burkholderiales bacterium JOSHI_001]|nr:hypothetical protein BurJ1DRAFT_4180 [Burkholderiales bacterium JOSHI_001]
MMAAARPKLFALPARRGWFPLVLPLLVLLMVVAILCREAAAWVALPFPLSLLDHTPTASGHAAPPAPDLLDHAMTASGLLEPATLASWGEPNAWLALPAGPFLARWLEPELRVMLGLRGKLSGGGPFVLPGPLLLQQAGPAAEALLRRSPPATTVAQAKG